MNLDPKVKKEKFSATFKGKENLDTMKNKQRSYKVMNDPGVKKKQVCATSEEEISQASKSKLNIQIQQKYHA